MRWLRILIILVALCDFQAVASVSPRTVLGAPSSEPPASFQLIEKNART
jgi:hypothetical protein